MSTDEMAEKLATKRKLPSADINIVDEVAKRQRSWLQRSEETESATWRTVKFQRVATKWWLIQLDNQIQFSTMYAGIVFFRKRALGATGAHGQGSAFLRAFAAMGCQLGMP